MDPALCHRSPYEGACLAFAATLALRLPAPLCPMRHSIPSRLALRFPAPLRFLLDNPDGRTDRVIVLFLFSSFGPHHHCTASRYTTSRIQTIWQFISSTSTRSPAMIQTGSTSGRARLPDSDSLTLWYLRIMARHWHCGIGIGINTSGFVSRAFAMLLHPLPHVPDGQHWRGENNRTEPVQIVYGTQSR